MVLVIVTLTTGKKSRSAIKKIVQLGLTGVPGLDAMLHAAMENRFELDLVMVIESAVVHAQLLRQLKHSHVADFRAPVGQSGTRGHHVQRHVVIVNRLG